MENNKSGNVKRRNLQNGKTANVIDIIKFIISYPELISR